MSLHRRSPRPLLTALEPLTRTWEPDTLLSEVQRWWPEAVGPGIAAETAPAAERAGVLTISCSSSVWAHELDLMAPMILAALNSRLQRGAVTRLRCVATGR
jgi:predicted nucleic acid-binding Zn ribbon protein